VRSVALWLLSALVAFLVTAGAFLLLANLGSAPAPGDPIPQADPSQAQGSGPTLLLDLPEYRLDGLEKRPGQRLTLDVENGGDEELPSVDLTLDVASENTARPQARYYQKTVEELAPGEAATVEFEIDLSPPTPAESGKAVPGTDPREDREILEVRATAPNGASAVKTAVLAL
jgi:hypothetical protein